MEQHSYKARLRMELVRAVGEFPERRRKRRRIRAALLGALVLLASGVTYFAFHLSTEKGQIPAVAKSETHGSKVPKSKAHRSVHHQTEVDFPFGHPAETRVGSLAVAQNALAFRLFLPHHPAANSGNVTDVFLFPQGKAVEIDFPIPEGDTAPPGLPQLRTPYVSLIEGAWTQGDPLATWQEDIQANPDVGKTLCAVKEEPALCVTARSPSDVDQTNAAYVEFDHNGIDVELSGGESVQRLLDIAGTLR